MPEESPVSSSERARLLQERLVRTAYALHFTTADLAAQHERRADLDIPSAVDHRVQAKGWLALPSNALEIVRRWDPREVDLDGRSRSTSRAAGGGVVRDQLPARALDRANSAIERVFRSSLKVHAAMPLAGSLAHDHLREAVEELDLAVRDIRRCLLEAADTPSEVSVDHDGGAPANAAAVATALSGVARQVGRR